MTKTICINLCCPDPGRFNMKYANMASIDPLALEEKLFEMLMCDKFADKISVTLNKYQRMTLT